MDTMTRTEPRTEPRTEIDLAFPAGGAEQLTVRMGLCRLRLHLGEPSRWVSGYYEDPTGGLPLDIVQEGSSATITQKRPAFTTVPNREQIPECVLGLGQAAPFDLRIDSGASDNRYDLGGVPLTRLEINQGASKLDLDFSLPNPVVMRELRLAAGAAEVEAHTLANARCAELYVEGGAAGYRLEFGGALQADMHAHVSVGLAGVEILIPAGTAARVVSQSFLGGVDADTGFAAQRGGYWTPEALRGNTPLLTIDTSVALGGVRLRTIRAR